MSNREPMGPVGILGDEPENIKVGKTIVARITGVTDADGIDYSTNSVQWLRNDEPIEGATGIKYVITEEDQRKYLSVLYSYVDKKGNAETVKSKPSPRVPEERFDTLYILYKYLLKREPDEEGLIFWADEVLKKLEDQGDEKALAKTIDFFMSSDSYKEEISKL